MGMRRIYICNLCGHEYTKREDAMRELMGLDFSGMRKFKLDTIDSTDGYHVCIWCAGQIVEQAPKLLEGKVVLK